MRILDNSCAMKLEKGDRIQSYWEGGKWITGVYRRDGKRRFIGQVAKVYGFMPCSPEQIKACSRRCRTDGRRLTVGIAWPRHICPGKEEDDWGWDKVPIGGLSVFGWFYPDNPPFEIVRNRASRKNELTTESPT